MSFQVYPAVIEATQALKNEDIEPKRLEIGRKTHQVLSEELQEDEPGEIYIQAIFEMEVEVRDDVEGFKLIGNIPGKRSVRILHGEEYL